MKWRFILILLAAILNVTLAFGTPPKEMIDLSGTWKFQTDPKNVGLTEQWQKQDFDASKWRTISVPSDWESQGITEENSNNTGSKDENPYSGYAWYRRSVDIPENWAGQKVYINLGQVNNQESVYVNGIHVGTALDEVSVNRIYAIPEEALRPGKPNIIAIRVWNPKGTGGIVKGPVTLTSGSPETFTQTTTNLNPRQRVQEDATRVNSDLVIQEGQTVNNATVVRGDLIIKGTVNDDASAIAGDVVVYPTGKINGDVTSIMGDVRLQEGAWVGGDVATVGGKLEQAENAVIMGDTVTTRRNVNVSTRGRGDRDSVFEDLLFAVLFAVLATIIAAITPGRTETLAQSVAERPLASFGVGLLGFLLILPVTLLLIITIIGIPLVFVLFLVIAAGLILGLVGLGLFVGQRVTTAIQRPVASIALAAGLGVLLIDLVCIIPVVGGLIWFIATAIGFGAVILTGFGTSNRWLGNRFGRGSAPTPPQAPPPSEPATGTTEV